MPFSRDRLKRRRMPPLEDKVFDNQQYRRPQRPSIMPGPGGNRPNMGIMIPGGGRVSGGKGKGYRPNDIKIRTQGSAPARQRPSIMPGPTGNSPNTGIMIPGGGLVNKGQGLGKYNPGGRAISQGRPYGQMDNPGGRQGRVGGNMFMPGGGAISQGRPSIMPGPRGQRPYGQMDNPGGGRAGGNIVMPGPYGRGLGRFNPGGSRFNQRRPEMSQMVMPGGGGNMGRPSVMPGPQGQRPYGQMDNPGGRAQYRPRGMERRQPMQQGRPMSRRMQREQMYSRGRPRSGGYGGRRPMRQSQQRWGAY